VWGNYWVLLVGMWRKRFWNGLAKRKLKKRKGKKRGYILCFKALNMAGPRTLLREEGQETGSMNGEKGGDEEWIRKLWSSVKLKRPARSIV